MALDLTTRRLLARCFGRLNRHKEDPLEVRAAFAEQVRRKQVDGLITIVFSGMDCDCVKYVGKKSTVPAIPVVVNARIAEAYEWADGPMSWYLMPPNQAKRIEYRSVDLGAEAHEDGHPYTIHDRSIS